MRSRPVLLAVLGALVLVAAGALAARSWRARPAAHAAPRELWLYQSLNLADDAVVATATPLWRRAAAAGYSRIVLVDPKFARLGEQGETYFAHLRELRALAAGLHLEIVPGVALVGRGNGALLASDPNLAEALPVRGARFEVRDGLAHPVADPPVALAAKPDRVDPGVTLTDGVARMPGGPPVRIAWTIDVAPWRLYHVSVRVAGEDFRGEPRVRVSDGDRELAAASVAPPEGGEPETRDVVFNSQDHRRVQVWCSLSRSSRGTLAWSDWRIEEAGPVNVIRRGPMAFRFDGLEEGRDFDPVTDPGLGTRPSRGSFEPWHEPPPVRVRRPDGTRLTASWWSAGVILRGQASVCLSDTTALARVRDEIGRVKELFEARTLFLMHDEIRILAQDSTCLATGKGAARILAEHVRACRRFAGDARVLVWNDMFDPDHNAVDGFYLVRGDLAGSWEGLDRDVVIVNWNREKTDASLRFFAGRGHEQVWAGYYDEPLSATRAILPKLDRTPNVTAVMYTTWKNRYDDLEAFAQACRGR